MPAPPSALGMCPYHGGSAATALSAMHRRNNWSVTVKPKERPLPRPGDGTLFRVDLQLESVLDEPGQARLRSALSLRTRCYSQPRIARTGGRFSRSGTRHSASTAAAFKFAIEFMQDEIREQGREQAASQVPSQLPSNSPPSSSRRYPLISQRTRRSETCAASRCTMPAGSGDRSRFGIPGLRVPPAGFGIFT
jgi:hypothetical protein